MTAPSGRRPPRAARLLLWAALPADVRERVVGDLDAEYRLHVTAERTRAGAYAWYWRQVFASVVPALSMRRRRGGRGGTHRTFGAFEAGRLALQDLRHAARFLRLRPGFAAAAILTFALGIGANTAIFSIVYGVLLRPLPYPQPDRLIRIWSANPRGIPRNTMSPPDFFDVRDAARHSGALDDLAAFTTGDNVTLVAGEPHRVAAASVSVDLFQLLGVAPQIGIGFGKGDAAGNRPAAVVLSDAAWKRYFAADPAIAGRQVTIDGTTCTVNGVMPATFAFPSADVDVWMPLPDATRARSRSAHYLDVVGRLSAGATIEGAEAVLRTTTERLAGQYPSTNAGWGVNVARLHDAIVGDVRRPLFVLFAAVGCVLLVACANVSSLLLSSVAARGRELAVRSALGAGRFRVVRQQLLETALVAAAGTAIGLVLAAWGLEVFRTLAARSIPRMDVVGVDGHVLLATMGLALAAGLVTGLVPALKSAPPLTSPRTAGASPSAKQGRSVLVAAQIALTLALTAGAGLLVRSFATLAGLDAGFRADHVLLAEVALPLSSYQPAAWSEYFERGAQELRTIPGVDAAGAVSPLPLSGQRGLLRFGLVIDGRPPLTGGTSDRVYLRWATPGYFRAMGIAVLQGREFTNADGAGSLPVAIVDAAFVRRHFPGADPIGKRVRASNDRTLREIVGVVGAVRQATLEDEAEPHLYVAQSQNPSPIMTFVVRTEGEPAALAAAVRERLRTVDPRYPVFNVRTLSAVVDASVAGRRINALVLGLFAVVAAVLTLVGIYGAMACWVAESTREIGVRIALGAARREILSLVFGRSLQITAGGAAVGLLLALAGGRAMRGLLFGVGPADPLTLIGATAAVVATGLVASYLPARRALRIDPAESLRNS